MGVDEERVRNKKGVNAPSQKRQEGEISTGRESKTGEGALVPSAGGRDTGPARVVLGKSLPVQALLKPLAIMTLA